MKSATTAPKPREIVNGLETIRAHWSSAKRQARRELAQLKQSQLVRCLTSRRTTCQNAG